MANRVIEAKRLKMQKQQRMRRAYLKPYSGLMKVPQSVDKTKVPESAEGIFDYRKRGNTSPYDPYFDALFPGVKRISSWKSAAINAKHQTSRQTGDPIPQEGEDGRLNGRAYCLCRADEERIIDMLLADEADNYVTVREGGITKTRITMMYNNKYSHIYFIETCTHPSAMYVRWSIVYGDKDRALFALDYNRIVWIEIFHLSSTEPDPPSG